ncbi:MAG: FKBP-type peptidyl-prolyl cis-trans isomerase [Terracidiphilus sp.]|nr:FKBP-type peptidyl-prolyl cis-trans isomerase [Terracidiphilus sp.]
MKLVHLALIVAFAAALAGAQTAPKPATTAKSATPARTAASTAGVVLPKGVPPVRGIVKTAFALRYQDIKLGTGAEAEPNKIYHVLYTGYLALDGHKFDSSDDHRQPLKDKDGKPVLDEQGKPKLSEVEPLLFPQGFGRVIPGFDQGFTGMKIGGKRRLFIPWQLAYGAKGRPGPDAAHPGIPPKADLIFDIELVDVTDMPSRPPVSAAPIRPAQPAGTAAPAPAAKPTESKPAAPAATAPAAAPSPQPKQ